MELRQYASVLLKWWWLILVSVAMAGTSAYFATIATPSTYQSHTTLMVGQVLQNPNANQSDLYTGQALAQSYSDLANREPVLQAALNALGLEWDWTAFQAMVQSQVVPGTQLLEITVTDADPQRAKVLADEVAHQLISQSPSATDPEKEAERRFILTQIEELKTNIKAAQDETLQLNDVIAKATSARQIGDARDRQVALQIQITTWQSTYAQLLSNLQKGTPNFLSVVEPAQIGRAMGPRVAVNVMLAVAIGFVLAAGAGFLLEYLDDTLKTSDDASSYLNVSVLGTISRIEGKEYPQKLITARQPRSPVAEAYRILRTNLQFSAIERPLNTLMVTSSTPLEGKSVTAANLAVIMAQAGKRVILIDADLRRPTQHHIFAMSNNVGLTTVLLDVGIDLVHVLRPTEVENLQLLTAGPLPPNPSELLGSKRMTNLVKTLLDQTDVIVFDTPPVTVVADPTVLASHVDGVLVVIDAGRTRRVIAKRSIEALTAVGAHVLGVTLNRLNTPRGNYYHYYAVKEQHRPARFNPLRFTLRRNGHSVATRKTETPELVKPSANGSKTTVGNQ